MLSIHNVSVSFSSYSFGLRRRTVQALRNCTLQVDGGRILAVVGQSGGGKSLLAQALVGLLPRNAKLAGDMYFRDQPLSQERMVALRGKEIALIPQSVAYLNPVLRVGAQIARAACLSGHSPDEAKQAMAAALNRYRLPENIGGWYPHQLSGGMARRVLVATATVGKARLLVADEPTNGLDGPAAREALGHLRELADTGKAVLLITHDIEAALGVADEVAVICNGSIVDRLPVAAFHTPGGIRHSYTWALWQALPSNNFLPVGQGGALHQVDQEVQAQEPLPMYSQVVQDSGSRYA